MGRVMNWLFTLLFGFGPAVLGIAALVNGIVQLRRSKDEPEYKGWHVGLAVFSWLFALGVGTCYGLMFLSALSR